MQKGDWEGCERGEVGKERILRAKRVDALYI
jgi:hypothetical protein